MNYHEVIEATYKAIQKDWPQKQQHLWLASAWDYKTTKEDRPMALKVGDLVRIIGVPDEDHVEGDIGTIVGTEPGYGYEWSVSVTDKCTGVYDSSELELVKKSDTKGDNMSVSPQEIKNLKLKDDDRLLVESGYMTETGEPTNLAETVLKQKYFDEKKDELVADIKAVEKTKKATK